MCPSTTLLNSSLVKHETQKSFFFESDEGRWRPVLRISETLLLPEWLVADRRNTLFQSEELWKPGTSDPVFPPSSLDQKDPRIHRDGKSSPLLWRSANK